MKVSETMKVGSVYVAWGFLATGALGWALFVVLEHFHVQDRTGWAQAIGSVLAIAGAAAFPYIHEREKERRQAERIRAVLLMLANNQKEFLRLLHLTLRDAASDHGEHTITPYLDNKWDLRWPPHIEALSSIQITELDAEQVYILCELKVGAEQAWSICQRLPNEWYVIGDREMNDVKQLRHAWEKATFMVGELEKA